MKRKDTVTSVDKEVFKRTASKSKSVNLSARIYRGGTRL